MRCVEPDRYSFLNLAAKSSDLLRPAFKFIEYYDILAVDF